MYSLPSTSRIIAPAPEAMKIGSRPIDRIARTGELTPPGSSGSARAYSSLERVVSNPASMVTIYPRCFAAMRNSPGRRSRPHSHAGVLAFPVPVVRGEIQQSNLLELRGGVQRCPFLDTGLARDRVQDRVAFPLGAAVGHCEHRVGPVLVGRPLIAVGDPRTG